ncbi:MAG: 30S ribosomal protein S9 [Candidatus Aenigmatarchaeota archaeon]
MQKLPKIIHVVGKRKMAIARITFKLKEKENNSLNIRINSIPLNYWGTESLRWRIREVLLISEEYIKNVLPKYEIKINVRGGGLVSQADAIRQALAKALIKIIKGRKIEELFYNFDPWLLKRDFRMNEPHHSSGKGASSRGSRRHKQRSKR